MHPSPGIPKMNVITATRTQKRRYDEIVQKTMRGCNCSTEVGAGKEKKDKRSWKKNLFNKDDSEAVLFVPITPNEKLAKRCESAFGYHQELRLKVVERKKNTINCELVKSNPFEKKGCHCPSCNLCSTHNQVNYNAREVAKETSCAEDDERCKKVTKSVRRRAA